MKRVPAVFKVLVVCLVAVPLPDTDIPVMAVPFVEVEPSSAASIVVVVLVKLLAEEISHTL